MSASIQAPASTSRGFPLASLALALIMLPILAERLFLLPMHIALNPNEGWNALHTEAWLAGRALYLDPAGPVLNNYPPLSFGIVALLGRLTGDLIVAGRMLSLVSLLTVATFSGIIACMMTGVRAAGWFTGALVLTTFLVGYTDYVAMNDPQMLALALSTLGLWALVRHWDSPAAITAAMVLMLLAGLAKHNMIALPIATLIALTLDSPRRGVAVAIGGAVATALALGVIYVVWGPESIRSLLAGRQWNATYLAQNIVRALPVLALPLAALVAGIGLLARRGPERLLVVYACVALVVALLTGGGAGVYYNCFFDLAIASCIVAGIVAARATQAVAARYPQARFLPLALTVGVVILATKPLLVARWNMLRGDATRLAASTADDVARIRAVPGPVACETSALCYWAGKGFELDYFNARQAVLTGRAGGDDVLSMIRGRKFELIQLQDRSPGVRLSPPAPAEMAALDSNYVEVHHSATGLYLVPRRQADAVPSP
jgi:hypothetical protein